jgi:hypothetical protein
VVTPARRQPLAAVGPSKREMQIGDRPDGHDQTKLVEPVSTSMLTNEWV